MAPSSSHGIERQQKHLAKHGAGERPQRDRGRAQQIGGSPPFQRRNVLLLAEEQQHRPQHGRDHGGNQMKRGGIERHVPPARISCTLLTRIERQSVCVIRKSTVAVLAFRLRRPASFKEKFRQLRGK
jgi:hypothetical protein